LNCCCWGVAAVVVLLLLLLLLLLPLLQLKELPDGDGLDLAPGGFGKKVSCRLTG